MDGTTTLGTGTLSTTDGVTTATFTTTALGVGSHSITAVYDDSYGLTDTVACRALHGHARFDHDGGHGLVDRTRLRPVGHLHGHGGRDKPRSGPAHGHGDVHGRHDDARHRHARHVNGVTTATFTTSALALGSHSITAVYSGDTNDVTSTSAAADLQCLARYDDDRGRRPRRSATVYGQSVTFTATVAVSSPGAGQPTGTVTFMDGTTTLGTGTLSTSMA